MPQPEHIKSMHRPVWTSEREEPPRICGSAGTCIALRRYG